MSSLAASVLSVIAAVIAGYAMGYQNMASYVLRHAKATRRFVIEGTCFQVSKVWGVDEV